MVKLVDWPCASLSAAIHDVDFTVHVIVLYLGIVFIAEFSARNRLKDSVKDLDVFHVLC
jgi:hypothetical protein